MVLALLVTGNSLYAQYQDVEEEYMLEEDGFRWISMRKYDAKTYEYTCGAKDKNGKVIIPLSTGLNSVCYSNEDDEDYPPYFMVTKGYCHGAYTIDGRMIVAPMNGRVYYDIDSDVFVFKEYEVEPVRGNSETYYTNLFSNNPWYSLGVSLTKNGEPYLSNKYIVSYSKYYKVYYPPITCTEPYTSSSAPILNEDNLTKGFLVVAAGAAIIAGISDLLNSGKSKSSSSSSNSSNNNKMNTPPHKVVTSMSNVDILGHYYQRAGFDKEGYLHVELRNRNNYDVYVLLEACVDIENDKWVELVSMEPGSNGNKAFLRAGKAQDMFFSTYSSYKAKTISIKAVY